MPYSMTGAKTWFAPTEEEFRTRRAACFMRDMNWQTEKSEIAKAEARSWLSEGQADAYAIQRRAAENREWWEYMTANRNASMQMQNPSSSFGLGQSFGSGLYGPSSFPMRASMGGGFDMPPIYPGGLGQYGNFGGLGGLGGVGHQFGGLGGLGGHGLAGNFGPTSGFGNAQAYWIPPAY